MAPLPSSKNTLHRIADDLGLRSGRGGRVVFELRGERDLISDMADEAAYQLTRMLAAYAEFHRLYGP